MSPLNETLKTWTHLGQKANEPFLSVLKGYEAFGQSLGNEYTQQLEAAFNEAKTSGETLMAAKTITDALTVQRDLLTVWTGMLQQQAASWAQITTDATDGLTQVHKQAGTDALDLLGKAAEQLGKDAVNAVDQYLATAETALTWMLKLAAQPKSA